MPTNTNRRKAITIALGAILLVLFSGLAALNAFNLKFLNPATTQQIFLFTGLSIVAFLLFVAVLFMLVRNVLKLYADQRSRVMGARLRTRMLWGAVLVSLIPIVFMFTFSYGLMNRAVERWFSGPVTQMRDDSNNMALELSRYTTANARAEADSIATSLPALAARTAAAPSPAGQPARTAAARHIPNQKTELAAARQYREKIQSLLRQHEITLQNGFAIVYSNGHAIAALQMPESPV